MKEYESFGEMEPLANEPYTIKVKYHEGASRIGGDIHGVMCDLAAQETVELKQGEVKIIPLGVSMKLQEGCWGLLVPRSSTCLKHGIMMANSVGVVEPDYCGDDDVWGFVAYAIRDTTIEQGTRIAQFMPIPLMVRWDSIRFKELDSMPYPNRGGYGSTGEKSAEVRTAEGLAYRGANGLELHVGDYVIDEFGERYCVMGLHEGDGATAAYADLGNSRTSLEVAPCLSLRLDERPHDCDGVPIEVGDAVYPLFDGELQPGTEPWHVARIKNSEEFYAEEVAGFCSARYFTHRKPDSWEKLEEDAKRVKACDYAHAPRDEHGITVCRDCRFMKSKSCRQEMIIDMIARAKRLAGIEEQEGE